MILVNLLLQYVITTLSLLPVAASGLLTTLSYRDGKSNYMEGLMLITLYLVIALACAFHDALRLYAQANKYQSGSPNLPLQVIFNILSCSNCTTLRHLVLPSFYHPSPVNTVHPNFRSLLCGGTQSSDLEFV